MEAMQTILQLACALRTYLETNVLSLIKLHNNCISNSAEIYINVHDMYLYLMLINRRKLVNNKRVQICMFSINLNNNNKTHLQDANMNIVCAPYLLIEI